MFAKLTTAREELKAFTADQIDYARRAYEDMLSCWNIDADDEDAVYRATTSEAECLRDWAAAAAEDGIIEDFDVFKKLVDYVGVLDQRSMAYC